MHFHPHPATFEGLTQGLRQRSTQQNVDAEFGDGSRECFQRQKTEQNLLPFDLRAPVALDYQQPHRGIEQGRNAAVTNGYGDAHISL